MGFATAVCLHTAEAAFLKRGHTCCGLPHLMCDEMKGASFVVWYAPISLASTCACMFAVAVAGAGAWGDVQHCCSLTQAVDRPHTWADVQKRLQPVFAAQTAAAPACLLCRSGHRWSGGMCHSSHKVPCGSGLATWHMITSTGVKYDTSQPDDGLGRPRSPSRQYNSRCSRRLDSCGYGQLHGTPTPACRCV